MRRGGARRVGRALRARVVVQHMDRRRTGDERRGGDGADGPGRADAAGEQRAQACRKGKEEEPDAVQVDPGCDAPARVPVTRRAAR